MMDEHLIQELLKELHDIRGALAVIKNDLIFFSTLLPPEETARPLRKCEEIGEGFSRIESLLCKARAKSQGAH